MTLDELKTAATELAEKFRSAGDPLDPQLRKRFVAVRSELIRRGIFDPLLVRFDSATVPKSSRQEVAGRLKTIAETLLP